MVLIQLLIVLLTAVSASALTFTQTGTEGVLSYTEPAMSAADTNGVFHPLTDLKHTAGTYDLQDGSGTTALFTEPASSASGGSDMNLTITVPVGPLEERDIEICVWAEDLSGNKGESACIIERIDRLPPGRIQ